MKIARQTPKKKIVELGSKCDRCGHCCSYGSGIVLKDDIKGLCKAVGVSEEELRKNFLDEQEMFHTKICRIKTKKGAKPYGACILYNEHKGCTINAAKPLHCRVGTCKEHGEEISEWFFLNHLVNPEDPESIRQWAIRLKVKKTIPGGSLEELVPDRSRLIKMLGYRI